MDIALRYDPDNMQFDLAISGGDLAVDETLQTAVMLSLFTDRRALDADELPDGTTDRRGWWADAYRDRKHGSRLWLLGREKELESVLRRAQEYAEEALRWMVEDGICDRVRVEARHVRGEVLGLEVQIFRGEEVIDWQFQYAWEATFSGGLNGV